MFYRRRRSSAKLGTPENPEIIEPGQSPRMETRSPASGRLRQALQILTWMMTASLPAFLLDSTCLWLFDVAQHEQSTLAWLLLILMAPMAFLATLLGGIIVCALGLMFVANLFGRTTIRLARF